METLELTTSCKPGDDTNFLAHIHSAKVHPYSLRWNYTFGLGVMCIGLFLILCLTGLMMMIYYKPDTAKAYFSIKDLMYVIPSGRFVRNIHRWSAHLMIIASFLHMARVFYTSAYKRGRGFNWTIGIVLFLLTLGLNFTGYLLPWDQLAYWAATIGVNVAASPAQLSDALSIPIATDIGTGIKHLLLGSDQLGDEALVRFYVLHCVVLPLLLVVLIVVHMWRIRKNGGLSRPDKIGLEKKNGLSGDNWLPAIPHALFTEFTAFMFVLAITVGIAFFFDAPLKAPADALVPENPAKAPWYFLSVQELVGYSAFTGGIGIPLITLVGLSLIPWFDREKRDFGRWLGDGPAVRIAVISAVYAMICCCSMLTFTIAFGWPGAWVGGAGSPVIHFFNPGILLMLMLVSWPLYIWRRHQSSRMGAIALFTCFFISVVVLTYFAWGHRGPDWGFYRWPLSWE